MATTACLQHALNPVTGYCVRCGRPMCDLCTFWVGTALFCPECLSSGPSADERSAVTTKGLLSIGLAVLGLLALAAVVFFGATMAESVAQAEAAGTVLGVACMGCTLGGISLGLIGREGAARTGSMLPLIGVVLNGVLMGLYGLLTLVGLLGG